MNAWHDAQDEKIQEWIESKCSKIADSITSAKDLRESWATHRRLRSDDLMFNKRTFSLCLMRLGYQRVRRANGMYFIGLVVNGAERKIYTPESFI